MPPRNRSYRKGRRDGCLKWKPNCENSTTTVSVAISGNSTGQFTLQSICQHDHQHYKQEVDSEHPKRWCFGARIGRLVQAKCRCILADRGRSKVSNTRVIGDRFGLWNSGQIQTGAGFQIRYERREIHAIALFFRSFRRSGILACHFLMMMVVLGDEQKSEEWIRFGIDCTIVVCDFFSIVYDHGTLEHQIRWYVVWNAFGMNFWPIWWDAHSW